MSQFIIVEKQRELQQLQLELKQIPQQLQRVEDQTQIQQELLQVLPELQLVERTACTGLRLWTLFEMHTGREWVE